MDESPNAAATRILMDALSPQPEQETEQVQPDREIESPTSETLEPEAEAKEAEASPQAEKSEEEISTLNKLAETLDIPIEDMYALNFNMPNGDPISLGALKDFYEQNGEIETSRQKLENEREALEEQKGKINEVPAEVIQAQANMMVLQNEWTALEGSGLRQSNPGEYAAKMTELQSRYTQAQYDLGNVGQVVEQRKLQTQQVEQEKLFQKVPELKDDKARGETVKQLESFVSNYGFSAADIAGINDHRLMHLVIEASKLYGQAGNARQKRVDTAPKVLKPQAVRNSEAGRNASLKRLTEKARQSGQTRDKVSAVSALLNKG